MAKLSYLELTNRVLRRITQSEITDVSTATGHAKIIGNLINEAQITLFLETNWYSLYTTRTFATVASTSEYAVASDFGRTLDLIDVTNNLLLTEDMSKMMDMVDANADYIGNPTHFTLQGSNYRLHPIPSGVFTIRDRYWKQPTSLSANANTSDLPIEVENCIIQWSLSSILDYLKDFNGSDRARLLYATLLDKAMKRNNEMIDRMHIFSRASYGGLQPPRFPSHYGGDW